ncbi:MAG: 1-acyl-sn-glycerol-3-phosphate acyltransferase [Patescibacteria group bacterium]|nr:1-acyl-sn-glycerol-3-phosphate acyltransferase [Patescibacteria group bacterium]
MESLSYGSPAIDGEGEKRFTYISPILLQSLIYAFSWVIFKVFCRFEAHGVERVRHIDKKIIFVANHSSEWDGILVRMALPFFWKGSPMYYVAMTKGSYTESGWRKYIYGGALFEHVGAYPVYYGQKDYASSLRNHVALLRKGRNVCIFPEGRRTKDGTIGEARGGAVFLAQQPGTVIVPVAIEGLVRLKVGELLSFKRRVRLVYGRPFSLDELGFPADPAPEDYKRAAGSIMQRVKDLFGAVPPPKPHRWFVRHTYRAVKWTLGPLIRTIWVKEVRGLENVPEHGPAIVAFNHQSYLDFLCFTAVSKRPIHYLSAEKFFSHAVWGPLMKLTGQFKVKRHEHEKGSLHELVHAHLDRSGVVGIFPEGTRSPHQKEMLKAFKGVARYALGKGVPVVPVGIKGTFEVMSKHDKKPRLKKIVEFHVGEPMHFPEYKGRPLEEGDYAKATHAIMLRIASLSGKEYPYAVE